MTYEQIIEKCIGLRAAFERDEARFFLGLVEVERKHMKMLRANGCDTFDQFIRSHELCRVERYRAFAVGLGYITPAKAERMGAPAVIALAATRDESKVPEFEAAVAAWSSEHKGLTPREETARKLLRQVDPRPEVPQALARVTKEQELIESLRAENKQLRAENRALRQRLAKLEKAAA